MDCHFVAESPRDIPVKYVFTDVDAAVWVPVVYFFVDLLDDLGVWFLPNELLGLLIPKVVSIMNGSMVDVVVNWVFKLSWNMVVENVVLAFDLRTKELWLEVAPDLHPSHLARCSQSLVSLKE